MKLLNCCREILSYVLDLIKHNFIWIWVYFLLRKLIFYFPKYLGFNTITEYNYPFFLLVLLIDQWNVTSNAASVSHLCLLLFIHKGNLIANFWLDDQRSAIKLTCDFNFDESSHFQNGIFFKSDIGDYFVNNKAMKNMRDALGIKMFFGGSKYS
ncbi:hypothetical protein ACJX0J_028426 [Zea mays]